MAGGWDGDALAEQLEDALERRQEAAEARARRDDDSTPEGRAASARAESLRLSKARVINQLTRATNPAHREMLERALRALEDEG